MNWLEPSFDYESYRLRRLLVTSPRGRALDLEGVEEPKYISSLDNIFLFVLYVLHVLYNIQPLAQTVLGDTNGNTK